MEVASPQNESIETWQVDAGGQIYETTLEEMTQWINEGALLPQDKVKRGNLRWIEAQKVPALLPFFNAKMNGQRPPVVTTTPATQDVQTQTIQNSQFSNRSGPPNFSKSYSSESIPQTFEHSEVVPNCLIHADASSRYFCETCTNYFCKACPTRYGEKVKICPICGAMVQTIGEAKQIIDKTVAAEISSNEGFGLVDFGRALAYPFKFPTSFIFGAFLYMIFTFSQNASSLGGNWLISSALISGMLGNTLTFGILANLIENMLQGKINENFMPSFDDFSLWDDVVQPFFLSIAVYISSFLGLIVLVVAMFFFVVNELNPNSDSIRQKTVSVVAPELQSNYGAAQSAEKQISLVKDAVKSQNEDSARKIETLQQTNDATDPNAEYDEEKEFQKLDEMINQTRKQQLESTIGQTPETRDGMYQEFFGKIRTWAGPFLIVAVLFTIWGVFYFPVASIVAAYTRNLGSVLNPLVGLDTIKRLGFDYVKILFMGAILLLFNGVISIIISTLLTPFDLPRLGNLPAQAIGSVFTFYFSIVFSVLMGYALFKNSNRFQLYRNS